MINEIDKFVSSMDGLNKFQIDAIKAGEVSYLKQKHDLDIDDVEQSYCFRSEYNFEEVQCANCDKIEEKVLCVFNQKVVNQEIEYQDITMYKELLAKHKAEDRICISCKQQHNDSCPIEKRNVFLQNELNHREEYKFKPMTNLKKFHSNLVNQIRYAIENDNSIFLSYSKALAAPLFKYAAQNNCLHISLLKTNTVETEITANCFNWFDTDNKDGEHKRYHMECIEDEIPIRSLASAKTCEKNIIDDLSASEMYPYMDINSLELLIKNVTIDVSQFSRNALQKYFNGYIKRYASYKADLEVLTTKTEPSYTINSAKTIQFIRYIYLLKISNNFTTKVSEFINDVYEDKYKDKIDIGPDKAGFSFFREYIDKSNNIEFEQEQYFKLFNFDSKYYSYLYFENWHKQGFIDFLMRLTCSNYNHIFDKLFLGWLMNATL